MIGPNSEAFDPCRHPIGIFKWEFRPHRLQLDILHCIHRGSAELRKHSDRTKKNYNRGIGVRFVT
jgi:hypothetical protein